MSKTVQTLKSSEPSSAALELMVNKDIGSVVIVDGSGRLVGIVTERDIVRRMTSKNRFDLKTPVIQIASKPVITATPKTKVWDAFTEMLRRKIRRLPVIENERLVGIVTERDLFKWVVRVIYEPNVPADLKKLIAQSQ